VLDNRLNLFLFSLVHESQSALQPNRSSLDSIAIATKIVHSCAKKEKKSKVALFKIDFTKTYDCIDWDFIINLLKARGFGAKWKSWIQMIFASSKSSILVNGIKSISLFVEED